MNCYAVYSSNYKLLPPEQNIDQFMHDEPNEWFVNSNEKCSIG